MSQYNSRIYIKVEDKKLWKNIKTEDLQPFRIKSLYGLKKSEDEYENTQFAALDELELEKFVKLIVELLEGKCIVIADTANINIDPYVYYCYYFKDTIKDDYIYFSGSRAEYYFISLLSNVSEWIQTTKIKLTQKEQEEVFKNIYYYPIELVYTNLGDRLENNENLALGQEVYLDKGIYSDKKMVEVFTNDGKSIGFIEEFMSKNMLKLIKQVKGKEKVKAKICEYMPLSKRNKNSRKALVKISFT